MMRAYLLIVLIFMPFSLFANSKVVNVYNWSAYIPHKVLRMFEKKTGITVNYTTYQSNEALYAKLEADPDAGYDVVFPSTYYVQRMAKDGLLHKLDLKKIPNIKYDNHKLLNLSYDPGNHYTVPYLWGTTGIVVNTQYYSQSSINQWQDFWKPKFKNQLLLLNDVRDVFSMSLRSLGYSINTKNPKQIKQAYEHLKALLPNIKLFNNGAVRPVYIDEDATVGMVLSGDADAIVKTNPKLHFIFPKNQVIISMDCASIVKSAPHLENAYKFINFINEPKIAKMISLKEGYSSPSLAAIKLMSKKQRENKIINPPQRLLENAEVENDVGPKATALYMHYWELLKLEA